LEDRAERGDAGCDADLAEVLLMPDAIPAFCGGTTPIAV